MDINLYRQVRYRGTPAQCFAPALPKNHFARHCNFSRTDGLFHTIGKLYALDGGAIQRLMWVPCYLRVACSASLTTCTRSQWVCTRLIRVTPITFISVHLFKFWATVLGWCAICVRCKDICHTAQAVQHDRNDATSATSPQSVEVMFLVVGVCDRRKSIRPYWSARSRKRSSRASPKATSRKRSLRANGSKQRSLSRTCTNGSSRTTILGAGLIRNYALAAYDSNPPCRSLGVRVRCVPEAMETPWPLRTTRCTTESTPGRLSA